MRITQIQLRNFKRFTDLVVRDIPETARIVVVVGPNGCGKSSLFDALLHWYRQHVGFSIHNDESYFRKSADIPYAWQESVKVTLAGNSVLRKGSLYVRTAHRNDPDFSVAGITKPTVPSEELRITRVIDNDQTVSKNYERLVYDTIAGVYNVRNDTKTVLALREELIGEVRASMKVVFGDLALHNISNPLGGGAFFFEKGTAKSYHYKNLSGGEKAAFDILLDLHVKKPFFQDAVYCIDEIETHLHTRVQGTLMRELARVLPEGAQLWVTTHSLGVLRAAQEMAVENPGSVCVIDFDGVDPDIPREIVPSNLGRVVWEKLLSIALDDLSQRIAPAVVVVCEGSSVGTRRKDFDAEIYNRILGSQVPDVLFVSGGSANQITNSSAMIRDTLSKMMPTAFIIPFADRDDKSMTEVAEFENNGGIILALRNLESFLFADDVICALVNSQGKPELLTAALKIKQDAIARSVTRGNPADDLKSAAGEIYNGLKQVLCLERCGNGTDAFMRDTLAPLIKLPMPSFLTLKSQVLDRALALARSRAQNYRTNL